MQLQLSEWYALPHSPQPLTFCCKLFERAHRGQDSLFRNHIALHSQTGSLQAHPPRALSLLGFAASKADFLNWLTTAPSASQTSNAVPSLGRWSSTWKSKPSFQRRSATTRGKSATSPPKCTTFPTWTGRRDCGRFVHSSLRTSVRDLGFLSASFSPDSTS